MILGQIGIVGAASIAQFIVGAIWYTPLFGKLWGKIHGFDKLDAKTQQAMMRKMGPLFAGQFAVTVLTSVVMVAMQMLLPTISLTLLVTLIWLGFVVPAQVGGVLFGGTKPQWMFAKMLVQAGGSLACLLVGAWIINSLA